MIRSLVSTMCGVLLAVALCVVLGCEDSGTDGAEFSINPAAATLSTNDLTVVLQAVGGHAPLAWSVSDASMGAVSGSGQTVTYTRTDSNGVNVVTVTDDKQWTASSTIVQN